MISRRLLLSSAGAMLLSAGCKQQGSVPASCTDTTGLSPEDVKTRETLGYQDRGPEPAKTCAKCTQYTAPAAEGACGGCKLLRGPIHPNGTCKAFALKA